MRVYQTTRRCMRVRPACGQRRVCQLCAVCSELRLAMFWGPGPRGPLIVGLSLPVSIKNSRLV